MNFKLKPLTVALIATSAVLSGCSTEEEKIEKTTVTASGQVNPVTGVIETAISGMSCQLPDVVQTIDSDFYPLTQDEKDALRSIADPDGTWTDEQIATWNSNDLTQSDTAYTYDYGAAYLYTAFANAATGYTDELGLTKEEAARRLIAKAEARAFKVSQGQDVLFGDGFDAWFDDWFDTIPYTDYLGASQRLDRAKRGLELSLSSANDAQEVCYTPPTECPNYKVLDESGKYDCVTPEVNPIAGAPAPASVGITGQAVVYFRKSGTQDSANYEGITIHTWNNSNCTAYADNSITSWGQGKAPNGIDDNYGVYWELDLVEGHDNCGNFIIYNKSSSEKFITQNDAMIPLGASGDVVFHNLDKITYFQEGFPANFIDGVYLGNQHPFFGAAAGSKSCEWGTAANESGEACIGQALSCPTGTLAVGVGQIDIASKCINEIDAENTVMYLRGGFNGWGATHELTYDSESKTYAIDYAHSHGEDDIVDDAGVANYGYKIADNDWSEASTFGGIKGGDVPGIGSTVQVTAGNGVGQDMFIGLLDGVMYNFSLDVTDPTSVQLTIADKAAWFVSGEEKVAAVPLVTFTGMDAMDFTYDGAGKYFTLVDLMAQNYTFTITNDNDTHTFDLSATETLVVGEESTLSYTAGENSVTIADEDQYLVVLDMFDTSAPTLLIKKAPPFGVTPAYVRGSMNDWGTGNVLTFDEAKQLYYTDMELSSTVADGAIQFKVASEDWSSIDMGPSAFILSTDTDGVALSDCGNICATVPETTEYRFEVKFADVEADITTKPELKLSKKASE